jgi:hypothetical protein
MVDGGPMEFIWLSLGMLAFIVVVLVLLARGYPGSGADLVDWRPTRSPETEVQLELDDVQQMIDAQNEMRRRRGAPDLTEGDARRMAMEDEAVRERARGSRRGEPDGGAPEQAA